MQIRKCCSPSDYLRINANNFIAFFTAVGEHRFVTGHAIRVLVAQHIALAGEAFIALPAAKVLSVPVLVHRLRVFATENKLNAQCQISS